MLEGLIHLLDLRFVHGVVLIVVTYDVKLFLRIVILLMNIMLIDSSACFKSKKRHLINLLYEDWTMFLSVVVHR